jgi:hypothetical protein
MIICLTSKGGIRFYLDDSDLESEEGRSFWQGLLSDGAVENPSDAKPTFADTQDAGAN